MTSDSIMAAAEVSRRTSEQAGNVARLVTSAATVSSGARKCGLLRLIAFFLLVGVTALALHRVVNFGLTRIRTSEFGVANKILSGQVNANVVISGSSRAFVHYDPRIIQNITGLTAFNLGRNAAQTDMQWAFLKTYLKHNSKPQMVIHNLDPYSFVLARDIYDPAQYMPYLYEEELYQPLCKINPQVWKWKHVPLYGYAVEDMRFTWMKALPALFGSSPREDCFLGYNPRNKAWTGEFERFKAGHPAGSNVEIQPEAVLCLEELIKTCREQGIQVVLVFSPEYHEMQALTINRAEIFSKFREMAERFKVPFWDYSSSVLCRRRELFYNSQHMNCEGASAFSMELAGRLAVERPWEAGDPPQQERASR